MTVECVDCADQDREREERTAAGLCPECGRPGSHVHQQSGYRHTQPKEKRR